MNSLSQKYIVEEENLYFSTVFYLSPRES